VVPADIEHQREKAYPSATFVPPDLLIRQRQLDRVPPGCHNLTPRSANCKRGIREQSTGSLISFMESVV
jgi:hypothetical protein